MASAADGCSEPILTSAALCINGCRPRIADIGPRKVGSKLTLAELSFAAAQLYQTGHSYITLHFRRLEVT